MKLILLLLVITMAMACRDAKYPQYVYNDCTKKWAVRIGRGINFDGRLYDYQETDQFIGQETWKAFTREGFVEDSMR